MICVASARLGSGFESARSGEVESCGEMLWVSEVRKSMSGSREASSSVAMLGKYSMLCELNAQSGGRGDVVVEVMLHKEM